MNVKCWINIIITNKKNLFFLYLGQLLLALLAYIFFSPSYSPDVNANVSSMGVIFILFFCAVLSAIKIISAFFHSNELILLKKISFDGTEIAIISFFKLNTLFVGLFSIYSVALLLHNYTFNIFFVKLIAGYFQFVLIVFLSAYTYLLLKRKVRFVLFGVLLGVFIVSVLLQVPSFLKSDAKTIPEIASTIFFSFSRLLFVNGIASALSLKNPWGLIIILLEGAFIYFCRRRILAVGREKRRIKIKKGTASLKKQKITAIKAFLIKDFSVVHSDVGYILAQIFFILLSVAIANLNPEKGNDSKTILFTTMIHAFFICFAAEKLVKADIRMGRVFRSLPITYKKYIFSKTIAMGIYLISGILVSLLIQLFYAKISFTVFMLGLLVGAVIIAFFSSYYICIIIAAAELSDFAITIRLIVFLIVLLIPCGYIIAIISNVKKGKSVWMGYRYVRD